MMFLYKNCKLFMESQGRLELKKVKSTAFMMIQQPFNIYSLDVIRNCKLFVNVKAI